MPSAAAEPTFGGLGDQVYNRLLGERIIFLGQPVDDDIANKITAQLLLLAADPDKDIFLYINSPGGSISAGLAIYDTMQYIKNDVVTIAMGLAASMGQFLLNAGTPGKRFALPNAEILIHQPSAGLAGSASDIKIHAERLLHTKKRMAELTAFHTGQTVERITQDSDRDRWFSADEAKEYGLIDDVMTSAAMFRAGAARAPEPVPLALPPPAHLIATRTVNTTMNNFPGSGLYQRPEAEYSGPVAESRYIVPRFVERTSQGVREYDPYAKLFEERVIFLGVQIDDASANDVMAQLLCLESMDPDRDISIYINSPGGSFTALTAIYDTMQFVKPDIQTVCMGQAASAAAVLLAARHPRQADGAAERPGPDPPAVQRDRPRSGLRPGDRRQRDPADAFAAGGAAGQALHHPDREDPGRYRA